MSVELKMTAKPWKPKDLLDDLQRMIDELPDTPLSDRSTLEMAKAYLEDFFANERKWFSVEDILPEDLPENKGRKVISCFVAIEPAFGRVKQNFKKCQRRVETYYNLEGKKVEGWMWSQGLDTVVTHWMPLPAQPKEE